MGNNLQNKLDGVFNKAKSSDWANQLSVLRSQRKGS